MAMINCKNWSECGINGGGCCAIGEFNGKPTELACHKVCDKIEMITDRHPII